MCYYGEESAQVNAVRLRNRVAFCIAGPRNHLNARTDLDADTQFPLPLCRGHLTISIPGTQADFRVDQATRARQIFPSVCTCSSASDVPWLACGKSHRSVRGAGTAVTERQAPHLIVPARWAGAGKLTSFPTSSFRISALTHRDAGPISWSSTVS